MKEQKLNSEALKFMHALSPQLQPYMCVINRSPWLHGPLLVMFISDSKPEELNAHFHAKKALADRFLKNVRFDPMAYLYLIERPYRIDALIKIRNRITDAQYWRCLGEFWEDAEYPHQRFTTWLRLFKSKRRYRPLMMRRKDRKFFEGLPKTLTIYRGYQHGIHRHKMGLSWTLSKEKAVWFAYRRPENGKPMVALGRCRKADVFCYTNGREEDEIIIDPAHITNVRTLKDIGPSPFEHH